jgi:hypothetical protein
MIALTRLDGNSRRSPSDYGPPNSKFAPDISGIAFLVLGRLVLRRHHRISVCCDRESKIFNGLVPGII